MISLCSANQEVPPKIESWGVLSQAQVPGMEFESKQVVLSPGHTRETSRELLQNAVAQASPSNILIGTGLWWGLWWV